MDPGSQKCLVCQQLLAAGTFYCVSCGHNNTDLDARTAKVSKQADARMERAKILQRVFRFITFGVYH